ncbi:MAG TPA: hypothetical protein VGC06_18690, partial [Actinomycetes bacterium]
MRSRKATASSALPGRSAGTWRGSAMSASSGTLPSPKKVLARLAKQVAPRWTRRHAMVVSGGGVGSGRCPSRCQRPSSPRRKLQQPSTGSQKYSSSVRP